MNVIGGEGVRSSSNSSTRSRRRRRRMRSRRRRRRRRRSRRRRPRKKALQPSLGGAIRFIVRSIFRDVFTAECERALTGYIPRRRRRHNNRRRRTTGHSAYYYYYYYFKLHFYIFSLSLCPSLSSIVLYKCPSNITRTLPRIALVTWWNNVIIKVWTMFINVSNFFHLFVHVADRVINSFLLCHNIRYITFTLHIVAYLGGFTDKCKFWQKKKITYIIGINP